MDKDFNYVEQDIIDYILKEKPDFVIQGNNTASFNGGGVANVIYSTWEGCMEMADNLLTEQLRRGFGLVREFNKPSVNLLGSAAIIPLSSFTKNVSLFTQVEAGSNFKLFAFQNALFKFLYSEKQHIISQPYDKKFVLPRIGCGIGLPKDIAPDLMWQSFVQPITKEMFKHFNIPLSNVTIIGLPGDNKKYGDT